MDTPKPLVIRAMAILWPSFLIAGVIEALFFLVVEPENLRWFGRTEVELSPGALHTLSFLVLWALVSLAGALTDLLEHPGAEPGHPRPGL